MKKIISITALVHNDLKKSWESYTLPQHVIQWNFASDDWQCPSASNSLSVGGKYIARMEAKDGSFGFDFEAIYDEVIIEEKLAYTMPDGRKATITFEQIENNTRVEVSFNAEMENPIEMQQDGWQAILNNFKKYTETL
jgi:uncharacterized protein YndB with AHSA1/START domain